MQHWVFTVGRRDMAPTTDWLARWPHHVNEMWFSKTKPPRSIRRGDRALIYGSQARGFIAAVEVTGDGPEDNDDERYPTKIAYRLLTMKAADEHVALPEDAGINPNRVVRGPHTKIEPGEYDRGVNAMLAAARLSAA